MQIPVVLGLDFGGTKIAVAVCETSGVRLGSTEVDTRAEVGARASLDRAIRAARALLDTVAPGRPLAAVGVSTFGIPSENGVALAPTVPGWSDIPLGRALREAFDGARIVLATDVKAAAQAEAAHGALVGCDPGIYLNLGTGLAVAIVVGGVVLTGRNGAAGEIGYNLRSLKDVGLPAAHRMPLEEAVSGMALLREASALLPYATGAVDVFARAADDPRMAGLLAGFVTELSFHLVNLAIAIDPQRIVVGGGMVRSWDRLQGDLRRALEAAVPYPPELVPAEFPFDAPLIGALALATSAAREALREGAPA
jgi:glucokinase